MFANQTSGQQKRKRQDGGSRKQEREAKAKRRKIAEEGQVGVQEQEGPNDVSGIAALEDGRSGNEMVGPVPISSGKARKGKELQRTGGEGDGQSEDRQSDKQGPRDKEKREGKGRRRSGEDKRTERRRAAEEGQPERQQPARPENDLHDTHQAGGKSMSGKTVEEGLQNAAAWRNHDRRPGEKAKEEAGEPKSERQQQTDMANESTVRQGATEQTVNGVSKTGSEKRVAEDEADAPALVNEHPREGEEGHSTAERPVQVGPEPKASDQPSGRPINIQEEGRIDSRRGKGRKERRVAKLRDERKSRDQQQRDVIDDGQGSERSRNVASRSDDSESRREPYQEGKGQKDSEKNIFDPLWKLSEPVGGRFIHVDPIFSVDERYLFIAKARAINVYSSRTSLLVRSLPISSSSQVIAYALSATNQHYLYVATSSGQIVRWNWVDGERAGRWNINCPIYGVAASAPEGGTEDTVYTLDRSKRWTITAHRLRSGAEASKTEVHTLYKSMEPIRSLKVLSRGEVIVAVSDDKVIIGNMSKAAHESLKQLQYTWREIKCFDGITCFDARLSLQSGPVASKKAQPKGRSLNAIVDIILGCSAGQIYVYYDLLGKLVSREQAQAAQNGLESLAPRKLHWHREAVNTAKWSLDGNYIISGGRETTLVLWQLDTGKKQFLPYLTSVIESLVVSPTGSSYAVRLADNSVMVLSTTELKPTANIAGIQSTSIIPGAIPDTPFQVIGSTDSKTPRSEDIANLKTPATTSPARPHQLLLAVPASQPSLSSQSQQCSRPFLQTFDVSSSTHVSRQALARTNTTFPNIGGDGGKLQEPSIRFLQISQDGRWLAAVDEWAPLRNDVDVSTAAVAYESLGARREIYLRFWSWDTGKEEWALETRIDAPHQLPGGAYSGRVLDLVSDPSSNGFATIGEDAVVRVWRPRKRLRYGSIIRGDNGEPLVNWSCRYAIELDRPAPPPDDNDIDLSKKSIPINGHLAFSLDGSVVAANLEFRKQPLPTPIHFISPITGVIRHTRANYAYSPIVAMAFLFRHLVLLTTSTLTVWDVVTDKLTLGFSLRLPQLSSIQLQNIALLAVNQTSNTLAVALPVLGSAKHKTSTTAETMSKLASSSSKVIVWDPAKPNPLVVCDIPYLVSALLPAMGEGAKGYIILDAAAEIRTLTPRGAMGIPLVAGVGELGGEEEEGMEALDGVIAKVESERQEDDHADDGTEAEVDGEGAARTLVESGRRGKERRHVDANGELDLELEDDTTNKPVVRPEQLAEIFEAGGLNNVRDIFEAVVGLYGPKPRRRVVDGNGQQVV